MDSTTVATPQKREYIDVDQIKDNNEVVLLDSDGDVQVDVVQQPNTSNTSTPAAKKQKVEAPGKENKSPDTPKTSTPTAKKPKRTKEQIEQEKKEKEEAKAQREAERLEKARIREEERARKEAEKKRRDEEREAKRREKEAEKRKKDEEKAAKEREKAAKERAQPKLASFFRMAEAQPKEKVKEPANVTSESVSEFDKLFLPFHVKSSTRLHQGVLYNQYTKSNLALTDWLAENRRERGFTPQQSTRTFYDSTAVVAGNEEQKQAVKAFLAAVPKKHIQFAEDYRPPYVGTWSKPCTIAKTPYTQLPDVNYDHDSEVEWVDPDEDEENAEDLNSANEMSDSNDEEDDMQDFLDDGEDYARTQVVRERPVYVRWNDGQDEELFSKFEAKVCLSLNSNGPIDPFHDYWGDMSLEKSKSGNQQQCINVSENQLREIVGLVNGSSEPKGVAAHNVYTNLHQKVSKKLINEVITKCLTKKQNTFCVIWDKVEAECQLIRLSK